MRWLIILVVIGVGCAWLAMRGLDQGIAVLDDAVALREQERQRVKQTMATVAEQARDVGTRITTEIKTVLPPPAPSRPLAPAAPVPTADLIGQTPDVVERRLGSPTGRVRCADGTEEWWYERRVLVFRERRVIGLR